MNQPIRHFIHIIEHAGAFEAWFAGSKIVNADGSPQVVYHQTSSENAASILSQGFDLKRIGSRGSDEQMPDGIFFKPTNEDLSGISRNVKTGTSTQMPFYLSVKNPLVVADRSELARFLDTDPEYKALARKVREADARVAKAYDTLSDKMKIPGQRRFQDGYYAKGEKLGKVGMAHIVNLSTAARKRSTEIIQDRGYDGLIVKHDAGEWGRKVYTIVVFDPKQVWRVVFDWKNDSKPTPHKSPL